MLISFSSLKLTFRHHWIKILLISLFLASVGVALTAWLKNPSSTYIAKASLEIATAQIGKGPTREIERARDLADILIAKYNIEAIAKCGATKVLHLQNKASTSAKAEKKIQTVIDYVMQRHSHFIKNTQEINVMEETRLIKEINVERKKAQLSLLQIFFLLIQLSFIFSFSYFLFYETSHKALK